MDKRKEEFILVTGSATGEEFFDDCLVCKMAKEAKEQGRPLSAKEVASVMARQNVINELRNK